MGLPALVPGSWRVSLARLSLKLFGGTAVPSASTASAALRARTPAARPEPRDRIRVPNSPTVYRFSDIGSRFRRAKAFRFGGGRSFDASSRSRLRGGAGSSSDEASSSGAAASPLPPIIRGDAAPLLPAGVGAGAGAGVTAGACAGAAASAVLVTPHIAHDRNAASAPSCRYVQAGQTQGSAGSIYAAQRCKAAGSRTHE